MSVKLSELIKSEREKMQYSQRELAKRIKIDNATISRIENGTIKKPNIDILIKLSNELKLDINVLFDLSGYNSQEIFNIFQSENNIYYRNNSLLYVGEEKVQKCISKNEEFAYIDIRKVLNNYKHGILNEKETIILIHNCEIIELSNENKITYLSKEGNIDIEY